MISKAEREADKAICDAASNLPWFEVDDDFVSEDRCAGIRSSDPDAEAIVTTDSGYYGPTGADAEHIVNACNRLPLYIAALEEIEARISEMEERAEMLRTAASPRHAAGMREVIAYLRGGQ